MRKTVAKRIRKYCARNGFDRRKYQGVKRIWNTVPRNKRFLVRKDME